MAYGGAGLPEDFEPDPEISGVGAYMNYEPNDGRPSAAGPPPGTKIIDSYMKKHVKKHVTVERVVEVPQTITKTRTRTKTVPQVVERFIEVPNIITREVEVQLPKTFKRVEKIVEVPTVKWEERIIRNEVKVIQERLIEVPKPEFKEVVEYDDRVEYREVPVDKIVEVPEIEYRYREVPHYVPQEYVQTYYVDKYTEVPMMQRQEVQRVEEVPVSVPAVAPPVQKSESTPHTTQPPLKPVPDPQPAATTQAPIIKASQTMHQQPYQYTNYAPPSPPVVPRTMMYSSMPAAPMSGTPPTPPAGYGLPISASLPAHLAGTAPPTQPIALTPVSSNLLGPDHPIAHGHDTYVSIRPNSARRMYPSMPHMAAPVH